MLARTKPASQRTRAFLLLAGRPSFQVKIRSLRPDNRSDNSRALRKSPPSVCFTRHSADVALVCLSRYYRAVIAGPVYLEIIDDGNNTRTVCLEFQCRRSDSPADTHCVRECSMDLTFVSICSGCRDCLYSLASKGFCQIGSDGSLTRF